MNVDEILNALSVEQVDYLLIGGMNFLLRHEPELTFDVDIWVRDEPSNLQRLNAALRAIRAQWGPTTEQWTDVPESPDWLERQTVFCLTTRHGALDIFRDVRGLEAQYDVCRSRAVAGQTATGAAYWGLSDADMLLCQEALPPGERKERRIAALRSAIQERHGS